MKKTVKKLFALNLALLMMLVLAVSPASAKSSYGDPYRISVGGVGVWSDEEKSGSDWKFDPTGINGIPVLTLDNYRGGGIRASGDLIIITNGTVSITGGSGVYAGDGIECSDELDIYVWSGSLDCRGGSGSKNAGDGLYAKYLYVSTLGGDATITGGNATAYGTDAGDAVHGYNNVEVHSQGVHRLTAAGGSSFNKLGGCGILSRDVLVDADCTLSGGSSGSTGAGGNGIFYGYSCYFKDVDARLVGSGVPAIAGGSSSQAWTYDSTHSKKTESGNTLTITANRYDLTLDGNGGTNSSGSSVHKTVRYPNAINLQSNRFTRNGYTQVGWSAQQYGGTLLPINDSYSPERNTTLYAQWEPAAAGDIILNGRGALWSDGSIYKSYHNTTVTPPEQLTGDRGSVLAWCDQYPSGAETVQILPGEWYAGGETVSPDPSDSLVLYAYNADSGCYAVYHTTLGTPKAGGSAIVQGMETIKESCQAVTPDASYLQVPAGCEFLGWSTSKNASSPEILPGGTVTLTSGATHYYAVWKQTLTPSVQNVTRSGNTVTANVNAGTGSVIACCASYAANGQMLECVTRNVSGSQNVSFPLTKSGVASVKVFLTDNQGCPLCESKGA